MENHEEELQKKLKELQVPVSMDEAKKESMKKEIRRHAARKRRRLKLKKSAAWFSTAAAVAIFSVIMLNMFTDDQSTLPVKEHEQTEYNGSPDDKHQKPSEKEDENDDGNDNETIDDRKFAIDSQGTETITILNEGMEEETEVTNYVLKPYGIHFQIDEIIENYEVADDHVTFSADDEEMASVKMAVREDADLEDVVDDIESDYTEEDFTYTEEPSETPQDENPYKGIQQHFSDPPQGYYAYQIGDDVLVIKYEYYIEAADGMGPRLKVLLESLEE